MADECREELKPSTRLQHKGKVALSFLCFIISFPLTHKNCFIFTSVKPERQEITQRLLTKTASFFCGICAELPVMVTASALSLQDSASSNILSLEAV